MLLCPGVNSSPAARATYRRPGAPLRHSAFTEPQTTPSRRNDGEPKSSGRPHDRSCSERNCTGDWLGFADCLDPETSQDRDHIDMVDVQTLQLPVLQSPPSDLDQRAYRSEVHQQQPFHSPPAHPSPAYASAPPSSKRWGPVMGAGTTPIASYQKVSGMVPDLESETTARSGRFGSNSSQVSMLTSARTPREEEYAPPSPHALSSLGKRSSVARSSPANRNLGDEDTDRFEEGEVWHSGGVRGSVRGSVGGTQAGREAYDSHIAWPLEGLTPPAAKDGRKSLPLVPPPSAKDDGIFDGGPGIVAEENNSWRSEKPWSHNAAHAVPAVLRFNRAIHGHWHSESLAFGSSLHRHLDLASSPPAPHG